MKPYWKRVLSSWYVPILLFRSSIFDFNKDMERKHIDFPDIFIPKRSYLKSYSIKSIIPSNASHKSFVPTVKSSPLSYHCLVPVYSVFFDKLTFHVCDVDIIFFLLQIPAFLAAKTILPRNVTAIEISSPPSSSSSPYVLLKPLYWRS